MLTSHPKHPRSRRVVRLLGSTLVVVLAGVSSGPPVLAQDVTASVASGSSAVPAVVGDDAGQSLRDRRAEDLVLAARELVVGQSWAEAGFLYEQAAALRAPADPRAIDDLSEAANLYAFGDDRTKSVAMLERAGERALEMGEVVRAATAFQQAAVLNAKIGGVRYKTTSLWEKVCDLSGSPRLTNEERDAMVRRVPICR